MAFREMPTHFEWACGAEAFPFTKLGTNSRPGREDDLLANHAGPVGAAGQRCPPSLMYRPTEAPVGSFQSRRRKLSGPRAVPASEAWFSHMGAQMMIDP